VTLRRRAYPWSCQELRMKGAERVTVNAPRVLYLVISGAPAPEGLPSLVTLIQESGWRVVVFSTPMGTCAARILDWFADLFFR
jgi:hypothetical protein